MSILFFMNELREGAGMINREVGFAKELVKRGWNVGILSFFKPSWNIEEPKITVQSCLPLKYYWFLYEHIFFYPLIALIVFIRLYRLKPTVLMVDQHQEAFWALLFRPFFRYQVVFTYHGVAAGKFFSEKEANRFDQIRKKSYQQLKKCDRVLVVSQFLVSELKKEGISSKKIFNGVDILRFNPSRRMISMKTISPQLLFVGRYSEYKGALNIVESFAFVKKQIPDAELIMHAFHDSIPYMKKIRKAIDSHSLHDCCHLFGPLSFDEVPFRINACSLFVNGSLDETFAMPLLEAQACGIPCVAFNRGGIPEVVKHNETGILVDSENVEEFGAAIISLLKDSARRKSLSLNALKNAQRYQYNVLVEELIDVFEELKSKT